MGKYELYRVFIVTIHRNNRTTSWYYLIFFICLLVQGEVSADALQEGIQYYRQGDYRHAVQALEKAATEQPDNANVYYLLGNSYQRAHRPGKAIEALKKARYLKSNLKHLEYSMGLSYFNSGQYVYAKLELEQALLRNPDNTGAKFFLTLTDMALRKTVPVRSPRNLPKRTLVIR